MALDPKIAGLFRTASYLLRILISNRFAFSFGSGLLLTVIEYRIELIRGLFSASLKPFDFNPGIHSLLSFLRFLLPDMMLVAGGFALVAGAAKIHPLLGFKHGTPVSEIVNRVFLSLILISFGLVHLIHLRLIFAVQSGLDLSIIDEGFSNIPFEDVLKLASVQDLLFLVIPLGGFWFSVLSSERLRKIAGKTFLTVFLCILFSSAIWSAGKANSLPSEIRTSPPIFLASDVIYTISRSFSRKTVFVQTGTDKSYGAATVSEKPHHFHLEKAMVVRPSTLAGRRNWNLVIFVMESVGTRYAFARLDNGTMPMPFLYGLSGAGWYLGRHYSTSNVSTKALFSLLTGRYDLFSRENLGTKSGLNIPSLITFLGNSYDSFLVTPSPIGWYFPAALVKNNPFCEVYSYENLRFSKKEEMSSLGRYVARDEIETFDFFLHRLGKAKEPFAALYISFVAHYPYFDYGEGYRLLNPEGGLKNRYINNLKLIDHMIERIHEQLEEQDRLKDTIILIVGDHGQAFGQHHPNNFMHYRYSYNENLEAPALLYQKNLFTPRTFDAYTSHIDILPTVLDAMGIPYESKLFDGRSLFKGVLDRRYLFFYGYERSITSLDTGGIKLQVSLRDNKCRVFDLNLDPEETDPRDCSDYSEQLEDLRDFVNRHNSLFSSDDMRSRRPHRVSHPVQD